MDFVINTSKTEFVRFSVAGGTVEVVWRDSAADKTTTTVLSLADGRKLYRDTLAAAPADLQVYATEFRVGDRVKVQTMRGVQSAVITHADRTANGRGYTLRFLCGLSAGAIGDGWQDNQLKPLVAADERYIRRQRQLEAV